jgi:1-acylglycerone phosphate reductase
MHSMRPVLLIGLGYAMPLVDTDFEAARAMFDVNLWGVIAVTKAFSPLLITSKGTIVQISSIATVLPAPFQVLYAASKCALDTYSQGLRVELKPFDIKVVTVTTGVISTTFMENMPRVEIKKTSPYYPLKAGLEKMFTEWPSEPQPVRKYATQVVDKVLQDKPIRAWIGGFVWVMFVFSFLPAFILDQVLSYRAGLSTLKQLRKSQ